MLIAAHHAFMKGGKHNSGTHVKIEMTESTGLYINFYVHPVANKNIKIDWGDGSTDTIPYQNSDVQINHTYAHAGKYLIVFHGARDVGLRVLNSSASIKYATAVLSVIDYSGDISGSRSGAYKGCTNLKCYIAPEVRSFGEADFYGCTNLETVVVKDPAGPGYYDQVFYNCSSLKNFTVDYSNSGTRAAQCWHNVWNGCSSLVKLRLGNINQFGNNDFSGCTSLTDVYIDNHTAQEIKNNFGKSYAFPWGANSSVKFHGTDGYVLGDGTIVIE